MLGWLFEVPGVLRLLPELPVMQPNTALSLLVGGLSLAMPDRAAGLARALAAFVFAMGLLTAFEYVSGRDLGIDDAFLDGTMRMAPQTALAFTSLGLALFARRTPRWAPATPALTALPVALCYLSLVGLVFGATVPVFPLATTMALNTGVAILILTLGLALSQPDRGLMARWRSAGPGGRTVRALLPAFAVLLPLLMLLREVGEDAGFYDRGFGIALLATAIMAMFTAGVLLHSRSLDAQYEGELREAERFRTIIENIPEGVCITDLCGRVTYANERLSALLGRRAVCGLSLTDCVDPGVRTLFHDFLRRAERRPARATVAVRAGDDELRSLRFSATPLPDPLTRMRGGTLVLVIDDTSRRIAEGHLRERAAQLEHALRDLEGFATLASHDLREPLRKIQLLADRAAGPGALPRDVDESLHRIRRAAAGLQERIARLLSYARLSASARMVPDVDVGAAVREAEAGLSERLEGVGASVIVGVLPTIEGDPDLLRQLFTCLLDNALKFLRPGVPPVIRIDSAPLSGDRVQITVADNGQGLDTEEVAHIFEVFRTVHGGHRHMGAGIGLATCRRIVELHGGEISARGTPGVGSVFTLSLPVRSHVGVPPECVPADVP